MPLIQPDGKIQLFNNLRIDSNYENTFYFQNGSAQNSFFESKVVISLDNQSYTRKEKSIKVNLKTDNIYSCDYLRFQNSGFGLKWFYAFITDIKYISNTVSEIFYEIDSIQTWYFNFTINNNFVERLHTPTDNLFEHIEPDVAPFGDDYIYAKKTTKDFANLNVCIQATTDAQGGIVGSTKNNIYSQLHVMGGVPATDSASLDALLSDYLHEGKLDGIINMFEYPAFCDNATTNSYATDGASFIALLNTIDGYTPKNKKCFCYPYNFLLVSNNQGSETTYRFEDFTSGSANSFQFGIHGVKFPMPEVLLYPKNHKRVANNFDDGIILNNFPTCCFSGSVFENYIAQHQNTIATNLAMTGINALSNVATNNASGLAGNVANVFQTWAQFDDMKKLPATAKGQLNSVGMLASMNRYGYTFIQKSLSAPLLEQIDKFFTKYGYAQNKLMNNINLGARPKCTYIKLRNASIYGNVPASDRKKLETIFNKGVTYWKSNVTVGDYSDNEPA